MPAKIDEKILKREAAKVIVITCDINCSYAIIGPVYFQVSNCGFFASDFDDLVEEYKDYLTNLDTRGIIDIQSRGWQSMFAPAFYIAVEELKINAYLMGANAIIGMKQDIDLDNDGLIRFYLQMYGTAVKILQ